ncbi:hypothetical protein HYY69_05930 [Candidatus Woesearchaeota archaeon]|nr:hypothetical protein [Candidatus Woesearchaeota archaeon]
MASIVFQEFHLDLDRILDQPLRTEPHAGTRLLDHLAERGYAVLEPGDTYRGLPVSILLGGVFGSKDFKGDFYAAVQRLGIPYYVSGPYYIPHLPESVVPVEVVAPRKLPSP